MVFAAEAESPIYLFELAATILAACLVTYRPNGNPRTCVLCIDNKAALAALIKGPSSCELGAISANLFWSAADRRPVVWRFEYVDTNLNADGPPPRVCDCGQWAWHVLAFQDKPIRNSRDYFRPGACSAENQLSLANDTTPFVAFQ